MTEQNKSKNREVTIIGGGPAGLTAAYQLAKGDARPSVYECDNTVGGISRTVVHNGYRFDIGGHRFFTKVGPVDAMWHEVLGEDFLRRRRLSRILYRGRFFHYPLSLLNAFFGLGPFNSVRILGSYFYAHLFPIRDERSFEDWVVNRFGRRLFDIFFKTYTEKVWGTPCNQISADWAAQRIRGLSLKNAVLDALSVSSSKQKVIKSLVDVFHYPRLGPGMMWERVADGLRDSGHPVNLNSRVVRVHTHDERVRSVDVICNGQTLTIDTQNVISTMPIRDLVQCLNPAPPLAVCNAANALKYRDFLTVAVVVDRAQLFDDNWIYIHDPTVQVGRIQNFKNWSPEMVPDAQTTCLGLEYFCFEDDDLWSMDDEALADLATRELHSLGLLGDARVLDTAIVRVPKAYPVYDDGYAEALHVIRDYLGKFANLQLVGRNGMHKYNNQDHSMLTAMLAAENVFGASHDLWSVNEEQEYHEIVTTADPKLAADLSALASSQPAVPRTVAEHRQSAQPDGSNSADS